MRRIATFAAAAASGSTSMVSRGLFSATATAADSDTRTSGNKVEEDRKKCNLLACRQVGAGTIGPLLVARKARFPDRSGLNQKIWDVRKANPATWMPPLGKHEGCYNAKVGAVVGSLHPLISAGPCPA